MTDKTRNIDQPELALDSGISGLSELITEVKGDESALFASPAIE